MSNVQDCYRMLGLPHGATDEDIKRAYRQRALEHHPDRTAGDDDDAATFRACRAAYEVLRDPIRRAEHDRALDIAFRRRPHDSAAPAQRPPRRTPRAGRAGARSPLGDLLEALFDGTIAEVVEVASALLDDLQAAPRWDRRSGRWRDRQGRFVAR